ncbi:hypothetical protein J6590_038006 [Homalodisca vitripennis]|nr:hypothetical protein J6590_038006 [Homalodisca vitripennis]
MIEAVSLLYLLITSVLALQPNFHNVNFTQIQEGRRPARSVSPWEYFPLLPQNIHDSLEPEHTGKSERDVHIPEFRPLCQIVRRRVELKELYGDEDYEYRPPHYFESICKGPNQRTPGFLSPNNLVCVYPGFSCVQRSQTIYLTRRRYDSNCWETFTRTIASNCECMWPVQSLGEVAHHY